MIINKSFIFTLPSRRINFSTFSFQYSGVFLHATCKSFGIPFCNSGHLCIIIAIDRLKKQQQSDGKYFLEYKTNWNSINAIQYTPPSSQIIETLCETEKTISLNVHIATGLALRSIQFVSIPSKNQSVVMIRQRAIYALLCFTHKQIQTQTQTHIQWPPLHFQFGAASSPILAKSNHSKHDTWRENWKRKNEAFAAGVAGTIDICNVMFGRFVFLDLVRWCVWLWSSWFGSMGIDWWLVVSVRWSMGRCAWM